jgi:hypothetical protein
MVRTLSGLSRLPLTPTGERPSPERAFIGKNVASMKRPRSKVPRRIVRKAR